ncbi:hypothetical protein ES708_24358 [subsurface metagenome]
MAMHTRVAAMNRSLLLSRTRVAMTAGTLHPNPSMAGMIAKPCSPILCMAVSRRTARRGRYPVSSRIPRIR